MLRSSYLIWIASDLTSMIPSTRYHGSKRKLLVDLRQSFAGRPIGRALDLYSGSGSVTLLLRLLGWQTDANDYLPYNQNTAALFLGTVAQNLPSTEEVSNELGSLLRARHIEPALVSLHFSGIYFTDQENSEIDSFCQQSAHLTADRRRLYIYLIGQALLMKRPFGLFHRHNLNLRIGAVKRSFGNKTTWDAPILQHALTALTELRRVSWPTNAQGTALCRNTRHGFLEFAQYDLVYLDPPYLGQNGATDYADGYHFLTGLLDYTAFGRFDRRRRHRPILNLPSRWHDPASAAGELIEIEAKWPDAVIVLSYRSDGLLAIADLKALLSRHGRTCQQKTIEYHYTHAQTTTHEIILTSTPPVDMNLDILGATVHDGLAKNNRNDFREL